MGKCIYKGLCKQIIIFTVIVCVFPVVYASANNTDWGLGYPNPGEAPVGNESVEYLGNLDAYFIGDTNEKSIYLTFDGGYEGGYTESILDTLKKYEISATFFLVGTYIRDNPELVKRMIDEGHTVGNHTMSHPDMSAISDKEAFLEELSQTEEIYKSITGEDMPKLYRPPRGKYSESNMQMAKDLGYKTIFWSLAYVDWEKDNQPTKEKAFEKLIPRIHSGAILLLHNTSETNSLIMEELIERYQEMGYKFKGLDELVFQNEE